MRIRGAFSLSKNKKRRNEQMMNEDSKKRLKAMAEAVAKLMKEQDE